MDSRTGWPATRRSVLRRFLTIAGSERLQPGDVFYPCVRRSVSRLLISETSRFPVQIHVIVRQPHSIADAVISGCGAKGEDCNMVGDMEQKSQEV